MAKYVFVTGGVVSGLGKGITASSIALLLKARGYKVFMQKLDPYINVDPGTMNPIQHGEVFVTYDGCETDLDLGHYERFIDEELNYTSNITSGKIYQSVIEKERRGEYLGATVQMIPHVTNEIRSRIVAAGESSGADIVITEIGGTVGDIESQTFLEAVRQMQREMGEEQVCLVHATLVPYIYGSEELKSKPTQNSVRDLRSLGIYPNILVLRDPFPAPASLKEKIALFCSVPVENIIDSVDVTNIYEVPMNYHAQKVDEAILKQFKLPVREANLGYWQDLIATVNGLSREVSVALVGKYIELHDAYISVIEALKAAGYHHNYRVQIKFVDAETLEQPDCEIEKILGDVAGIVVPGGFGARGVEGKIRAIAYAREHDVPFLGLCLGMQLAVIEFARHVAGMPDATSREFAPECEHALIDLMEDQKTVLNMGGTLRLGNYECAIKRGTLAHRLYGADKILERHRHRYEFNNAYREKLEQAGLVFSGTNPAAGLTELVEYPQHRFFIASQFHPEFKSRPNRAHPLFDGFIAACVEGK